MLNTAKLHRIKQARQEHALKLGFERNLTKKLVPTFRAYSKQFHAAIKEGGQLANIHVLQQNMKDVLSNHYDNVTQKFNQHIVNQIGKPENHGEILNSINTASSVHNELRANDSSAIIAQTTIKDANKAIETVKQQALAKGEAITNATLAARSRILLNQKISGRINTIAATETQNPAENSKQTEIDYLDHHNAEIDGENIAERKKQKQWIAILDNVTRVDHAEADGQTVDFDEPYEVAGQQLRFPGDMGLGATIDNVINCRCSSIIIIN
jgi:uncharacterized protein with gpF-like domain